MTVEFKSYKIKDAILKIYTLPVCLIILFVAIAGELFYWNHIKAIHTNIGYQHIDHLNATIDALATDEQQAAVNSILQRMVETTTITYIGLYSAQHLAITQYGSKTHAATCNTLERFTTARTAPVICEHWWTFSREINTQNDRYSWIVIEVDNTSLALIRYQSLLILALVVIVLLIAAIYMSQTLRQRLLKPFGEITSYLKTIQQDNINTPEPPEIASQELANLNKEIHNTALFFIRSKQEMQQSLEQSMTDLKETLETVEVQNIELSIARKKALENNKIKSEFLTNTSHELKTPLNGIIGFTQLLLKTKTNDQQQEYLRTIEISSQSLLTIINSILDFTRIDTGKLTLEHEPFDLREACEEVTRSLYPLAYDKNSQLILLIDHNVPVRLIGDALRLKQILNNLIGNAIKFSKDNDIYIKLKKLTQKDKKIALRISITDQGIGISKEKHNKLFTPFFQIDSSNSRSHQGTGLGLAIAKGIIEHMNGDIGLNSDKGEGSTFWFTIMLGVDNPLIPQVESLTGSHTVYFTHNFGLHQQLQNLLGSLHIKTSALDNTGSIIEQLSNIAQSRLDYIIIDSIHCPEAQQQRFNQELAFIQNQYHQKLLIIADQYQYQKPDIDSSKLLSLPLTYSSLRKALSGLVKQQVTFAPDNSNVTPSIQQLPPAIKILAVDDNPANLRLISEFLNNLQVNATLANNGKEAVAACQHNTFDLIFMDIQMPGMDGMATSKEIRRIENTTKRTPIVALSAHSMSDKRSELLLAGLDDYVTKPISEEQLIRTIKRWIDPRLQSSLTTPTPPLATSLEIKEPEVTYSIPRPVDLQTSLKLSNYNNNLAKDMLSMLFDMLQDCQQTIPELAKTGDMEVLAQIIHKIHGGSCYCGVPRLQQSSHRIDRLLDQSKFEEALKLLPDMLDAIKELLEWNSEYDLDIIFDSAENTPEAQSSS